MWGSVMSRSRISAFNGMLHGHNFLSIIHESSTHSMLSSKPHLKTIGITGKSLVCGINKNNASVV